MKTFKKLVAVAVVLIMLVNMLAILPIRVGAADNLITEGNLRYLATAMNTTEETLAYKKEGFGNNTRIFNYDDPAFKDIFQSSESAEYSTRLSEGSSLMEVAQSVEKEWGVSGEIGAEIPGVSGVSASIGGSYKSSLGSKIQNVSETSYQYLTVYQYTLSVNADWDRDLSELFSSTFIRDYNKIQNERNAREFIEKYGSHVFEQYQFGGVLTIVNQIVSSQSIQETYKNEHMEADIQASFNQAASIAASGNSFNMSENSINDANTQSYSQLTAYGGNSPASLNMETLFLVTHQTANKEATSYPLKDWQDSLKKDRKSERVVTVEKGVPVWKLIENSPSVYDEEKCELLKRAYQSLYMDQFAENLQALDATYSFLKGAIYVGSAAQGGLLAAQQGTLAMRTNSTVELQLDTTYLGEVDTSFQIKDASKYADNVELDGHLLTVKNDFEGEIKLEIYALGEKLETVTVTVSNHDFGGGSGSAKDPYILSNKLQFEAFMESAEYYGFHFKLDADIDLGGACIDVGGASGQTVFSGTLDGNEKTISNLTINAKNTWGTIGMFGVNKGTICDLTLENVRCINEGVIRPGKGSQIAVGVLVGHNAGKVENVQLIGCTTRVAVYSDGDSQIHVGVAVGYNKGIVSQVGVSGCKANPVVFQKASKINVGGLIGTNADGSLKNSYVRYSTLSIAGKTDKTVTQYVGGLVGNIASAEKQAVQYCMAYDVEYPGSVEAGSTGYICGACDSNILPFSNCWYSDNHVSTDCAVAGKKRSGCELKSKLTADDLKGKWSQWTGDSNNMPILKKHN